VGGHISRKHPGQSSNYKRKIEVRKKRQGERRLLKLAKQRFKKLYGDGIPINRSVIRRLKVQIKKKRRVVLSD